MSNCCGGLTLERWREILQVHPFHFWQLANSVIPVTSACNTIVREYDWQMADAVGRVSIRKALDTAVERLTEHLDYSPYPRYFEEVIPLHHNHFRGWKCVVVRLKYGRLIDFGVEQFDALTTDNLTVVVSDADGDGLNDTWGALYDGTAYDLENTYIYPAEAELPVLSRATVPQSPDCRWLRQASRYSIIANIPSRVSVAAPLPPMVKPALYSIPTQMGASGLDPATAANFLAAPRFYTRSTNSDGVTTANAAVIFEYDNPCGCGACSCDGQGLPYTRLGQAVTYDAGTGEAALYPATYNADSETWTGGAFCGCGTPDRVRVRYYAGETEPCKWDEVTARLAAAELAKSICACTTANRELHRWQVDLARVAGTNDEQYAISPEDLENPLGTRRGHVYAWQRVKRLALTRGFAL